MRFNDLHFASEILKDEKLDYAGGISFFLVFFLRRLSLENTKRKHCAVFCLQ